MKTPIRMLLVEDSQDLLSWLTTSYGRIFVARGYEPAIETATTVDAARKLAKEAGKANKPYDFVSLDVNLGDGTLTGLDVLATFNRFHSAWMVALLTGVESDESLDGTVGKERADAIRKQLRRDAYANFPAERLMVVEKPSSKLPAAEMQLLLQNRLEQIALLYGEIGRLRYIFRPIDAVSLERLPAARGQKRRFVEKVAKHWQIRFDCGEIRTLPDKTGFTTLHHIMTRGRDESVTPEQAKVVEPKSDRGRGPEKCTEVSDPVTGFFLAKGVDWNSLGPDEQKRLIDVTLSPDIKRYVELRGYQDNEDLASDEEVELEKITSKLGPLADLAEAYYLRTSGGDTDRNDSAEISVATMCEAGLHVEGGTYEQNGTDRRGVDSPDAQMFRARMKRVKDCLRENGFADLSAHLEAYLQSTGANWSYNPPYGVEWTTA